METVGAMKAEDFMRMSAKEFSELNDSAMTVEEVSLAKIARAAFDGDIKSLEFMQRLMRSDANFNKRH